MKTTSLHNQLVDWRHDFHMHPELGFEEQRTSERVAQLLESYGIEVNRNIGGTGIVGVLKKGSGSRSIALRADMDALPVTERNAFTHASKFTGKMHACGHDGHTTMLLGAAKYLADNGDFDGSVHFIFQPNEEHGHGAQAMLDSALFDQFPSDAVFAIHNLPGMEAGAFATRTGSITASESLFEIRILAQGGHAALPHMGVDALLVGAQIVGALQTIVSRKLDPAYGGVVSVTEFTTDGQRNVLPGTALLSGDARALTPQINQTIEDRLRQISEGICASHGVRAEVNYETVFPATINTSGPVRAALRAAAALVGENRVDGACEPRLFSDDFAHMAASRPGCYILMGNGTQGSNAQPLHSGDYDFNDEILVAGSSFWVELVEQELAV